MKKNIKHRSTKKYFKNIKAKSNSVTIKSKIRKINLILLSCILIFLAFLIKSLFRKDNFVQIKFPEPIIETSEVDSKFQSFYHISLCMALDKNYVYPTLVAMTSAIYNSNKNNTFLNFYLLSDDLTDKEKEILKSPEKRFNNCKISFVNMNNTFKGLPEFHSSFATYYRLLLPEILPNVTRIIYLDGDTLIYGELKEMFDLDMGKNYFLGIPEQPKYRLQNMQYFPNIDISHYVCAGVLLMNLEKLRNDKVSYKFIKFIKENNSKLVKNDQTIINVVCHDKIGYLPFKFGVFNFFSYENAKSLYYSKVYKMNINEEDLKEALIHPVIQHLVTCKPKPWVKGSMSRLNANQVCHSIDSWYFYANKTDYFNEIYIKYNS